MACHGTSLGYIGRTCRTPFFSSCHLFLLPNPKDICFTRNPKILPSILLSDKTCFGKTRDNYSVNFNFPRSADIPGDKYLSPSNGALKSTSNHPLQRQSKKHHSSNVSTSSISNNQTRPPSRRFIKLIHPRRLPTRLCGLKHISSQPGAQDSHCKARRDSGSTTIAYRPPRLFASTLGVFGGSDAALSAWRLRH